MIASLIGFILPPFIDLINAHVASEKLRFIISLAICIVVGAILNAGQLSFGNWNDFTLSAGVIFAAAQTTYNLYWRNSSPREALVEKIT